jgi:hypothetical protein
VSERSKMGRRMRTIMKASIFACKFVDDYGFADRQKSAWKWVFMYCKQKEYTYPCKYNMTGWWRSWLARRSHSIKSDPEVESSSLSHPKKYFLSLQQNNFHFLSIIKTVLNTPYEIFLSRWINKKILSFIAERKFRFLLFFQMINY